MIKIYSEENDIDMFATVAEAAFLQLGLNGNVAVELVFMHEDEMRDLNRDSRGTDKATDVLSFPALCSVKPFTPENYPYDLNEKGEVALGSVVICSEVADRQAEEYGHSRRREYAFLFLHGLLHLLGYDHIEPEDERVMTAAAESILARLNILRDEKE